MAILSGLPKRRGRQTAAGLARGILTVLSGVQSGRLAKQEMQRQREKEEAEAQRKARAEAREEERLELSRQSADISRQRFEMDIVKFLQDQEDRPGELDSKALQDEIRRLQKEHSIEDQEFDRIMHDLNVQLKKRDLETPPGGTGGLKGEQRDFVLGLFSDKTPVESLPGSMRQRLESKLKGRRIDDPETFRIILEEVALQKTMGAGGANITREGVDPDLLGDLEVTQQIFSYFTELNRERFFPDATEEEIQRAMSLIGRIPGSPGFFRVQFNLPQNGEEIVEEVTGRRDTSGLR